MSINGNYNAFEPPNSYEVSNPYNSVKKNNEESIFGAKTSTQYQDYKTENYRTSPSGIPYGQYDPNHPFIEYMEPGYYQEQYPVDQYPFRPFLKPGRSEELPVDQYPFRPFLKPGRSEELPVDQYPFRPFLKPGRSEELPVDQYPFRPFLKQPWC